MSANRESHVLLGDIPHGAMVPADPMTLVSAAKAAAAEAIRQRDEALARAAATVALFDAEQERARLATACAEAAERREAAADRREAETIAEIDALDRALSDAGCPPSETLAGRVAALKTQREEAQRETRALTIERDNCREVLRREREERAAESARLGNALQTLRAENNALEDSLIGLRKDNAKFLAQLALAERIIVAGLRG